MTADPREWLAAAALEAVEAAARRVATASAALTEALAALDDARATAGTGDRYARVRAAYARGLTDAEIAAELGVSLASAAVYRRACRLPARRGGT